VEIAQQLLEVQDRMEHAMRRRLAEHAFQLNQAQSLAESRVQRRLSSFTASLDVAHKRLRSSFDLCFAEARRALTVRAASLEALSPLAVMARGFVTCERGSQRIRSAQALSKGERVKIHFSDGKVEAKVEKVEKVEKIEKVT
jgi:exodeoxyribonuclease VII large subunit